MVLDPLLYEPLEVVFDEGDHGAILGLPPFAEASEQIEIHRAANGKPLIHPDDPYIVAIAADTPLPQAKVPVIDLDDIEAIADMLLQHATPLQSVAAAMRGA